MAKLDLKTHRITSVQEFFFDTSVWLLLYGNLGNYNKADQSFYTKAFQEIVEKQSCILITSQVISEITNVLLTKGFKDFVVSNRLDINVTNKKRDFVGTKEYLNTVGFISTVIEQILGLRNILRLNDSFSNIDIPKILTNFQKIDYNDCYYLELLSTRKQGTILVTNDGDFDKISTTVDIYTNK